MRARAMNTVAGETRLMDTDELRAYTNLGRNKAMELIIKDVLLQHALNGFIAFGESLRIEAGQNLADVGVHRKRLQMAQGKKTDTICYFFSHAIKL